MEQVADRMGLEARSGTAMVVRLESGKTANPGVLTVVRFLRAVGARWNDLAGVMDEVGLVNRASSSKQAPAESGTLPREVVEPVERQVELFRRGMALHRPFRPVHPQRLGPMVSAWRNYRLVSGMAELGVFEMLRRSGQAVIRFPQYRAVARHLLGVLWRAMKRKRRLEPGALRAHLAAQIAGKDPDWSARGLEPGMVRRVQGIVLDRAARIAQEQPDLLPGPLDFAALSGILEQITNP
jgi:transcriptional regulator with XRE-family HTH domain